MDPAKTHKHKWITTHTNKWMIPTKQACSHCDETREVDAAAAKQDLHFCWKFSDGSHSAELPMDGASYRE